MTNLLKNKMSSKILIVALLTIALVGGVFIPTEPAAAAISGGTVAGNAAADLVVNTSGADYNVTFDTDIAATADSLWVIFPVGYTITDGDLTTAAVSDGTIASRILVNGVSRAVNNVTGDAANRKITIVLNAAIDLGTGTGTSFRILTGIQNRTTAGNTGTFTIDSNATAEVEQANVAAVTLTSGPVHHLKVTAASATPTAGADDELTVTAYDQWDNVCSAGANAYTGAKDLTFSGLA
ncbi:MAG: hypothetical protein COX77_01380, partial [Candidatus Komeilibacteria bacterium CG_4_10_14_0_2_um_filter_37_10]